MNWELVTPTRASSSRRPYVRYRHARGGVYSQYLGRMVITAVHDVIPGRAFVKTLVCRERGRLRLAFTFDPDEPGVLTAAQQSVNVAVGRDLLGLALGESCVVELSPVEGDCLIWEGDLPDTMKERVRP